MRSLEALQLSQRFKIRQVHTRAGHVLQAGPDQPLRIDEWGILLETADHRLAYIPYGSIDHLILADEEA
jgi:hypothetical protein